MKYKFLIISGSSIDFLPFSDSSFAIIFKVADTNFLLLDRVDLFEITMVKVVL